MIDYYSAKIQNLVADYVGQRIERTEYLGLRKSVIDEFDRALNGQKNPMAESDTPLEATTQPKLKTLGEP